MQTENKTVIFCTTRSSENQTLLYFQLKALGQRNLRQGKNCPVPQYQSRHLANRFMSVNHFPYLPIVSDESGNQSLYPDGHPDRHQNLTICLSTHCQPSLKISCKSVWKFLRKVAYNRTNRQTNIDENITSLAEVNIVSNCLPDYNRSTNIFA